MAIWRAAAERNEAALQTTEQEGEGEYPSLRLAKLSRKIEVHREALTHGHVKLWCLAAAEAVAATLDDLC